MPRWPSEKVANEEQKQFVKLINLARAKGWTVEELAEALGSSAATVSRWDRGASVPSGQTAKRLLPDLRRLAKGKKGRTAKEWAMQAEFIALVRSIRGKLLPQDLAGYLGVFHTQVADWQSGRSKPHTATVKRLLPKLRRLVG